MTKTRQARRNKPYSLVSLGDTVVDLVFEIERLPILAEEVQKAWGPRLEPGGSGNLAIAGTRLGLSVHIQGAMGDDSYGHSAAQILAEEGVDISGIVHAPGSSSTLVLVFVDKAGQHTFLGRYCEGATVSFSALWRKQIETADAFYTVAYGLFESQIWRATPQCFQTARQAGVPIFLDLGPDMAPVPMDTRREACGQCAAIMGTESEVLVTTAASDVSAGVSVLLDWGAPVVVVKRGANGCRVYTREGMLEVPAFPVTLRDSTAAGDSFDVAFIYGYLCGYPLRDAAIFGNVVGAAKVQKVGSGRQVPTAQEVVDVMRAFNVRLPFLAEHGGDAQDGET